MDFDRLLLLDASVRNVDLDTAPIVKKGLVRSEVIVRNVYDLTLYPKRSGKMMTAHLSDGESQDIFAIELKMNVLKSRDDITFTAGC